MLTIYLVCFLYLLIATGPVRCKPDYLYDSEVQGWLKLHVIPATWEQAFLRCHYEGAVLASPLNEELTKALHSTMTKFGIIRRIFLGTSLLLSNGDFVSIEGVPLSDQEIQWSPQGPDPGQCLTMAISGSEHYMYTASCDEQLPYICYRNRDNSTMNECGTFDNKYHYNQKTGSCYKVHNEKHTWYRANMICFAEGGHLVILNDDVEANIVKDMFPVRTDNTTNLWEQIHIGLKAWDDRIWFTIHGDKIDDVYNQWAAGQPDNRMGTQSIGTILRSGLLDDANPLKRNMFVCEKAAHKIRFESPTLRWNELIVPFGRSTQR
nr:lymphocyte antigen 75 [Helicoverpa armigera]